jgi:hypothetical protein
MNLPSPLIPIRLRSHFLSILLGVSVAGSGAFLASCGSVAHGGLGGGDPQFAPIIVTQPTNQSSRVGQVATFSVTAGGTTPLTYQWSGNGTAVLGATNAVFNTAILAPGDDASTFLVTIANSLGSVTSNSVSVNVGPRAPQVGDLRFQQVDSASTSSGLSGGGVQSQVYGGNAQVFPDSVGTPLPMGTDCTGVNNPLNCSWLFVTFPFADGMMGLKTAYQSSDIFGNLPSDLSTLSVPDTVVTSLDLESSNDAYAISSIQSSQASGFSFTSNSILPTQAQAVASQLGQQSQVITAISYDSCGDVFFLAYAWQGDTSVYEVTLVATTIDNVGAAATSLAAEGYIITALGGNPTNGFLIVGTRVQGDALARPFLVVIPSSPADLTLLFQSGDAVVGYLVNSAGAGGSTWIGEQ